MASDALVREIPLTPPLQGLLEGRDPALPDALYPPTHAPEMRNLRVAGGKWETRRGQDLWQTLPGSGRVRYDTTMYTSTGQRIRLAARGNSTAAVLYELLEGTETSFNTTTGGTGLGGPTELRFHGVTIGDTWYFTDRYGALRKYQRAPSSGNQVRTVAMPTAPAAAPLIKKVTYDFLESWNNSGGVAPFGWTVADTAKFDIEDGTATVLSPMGGRTAFLNTKTNPVNSPISRTGSVNTPTAQIGFWVQATDVPNQIAFRYGVGSLDEYSENISPPAKNDWYPVFINLGLPNLIYLSWVVTKNSGAADTYVSGLAMPGKLQGGYRYRYTHYDPTLLRESALSPISNGGTPIDVSAIGKTGEKSTASAMQKAVALTVVSDSGSDTSTTQMRVYRSGGVPALTKDGRGLDVWLRVGTISDVSTTLSGAHSASPTGTSTLTVASTTGFAAGDWVVIAKGSTGTNGEEFVYVNSITDGTHMVVSRYPCPLDLRGLANAHTNGQTVQIAFVDNVANEAVDTSTRIYPERNDPPTGTKWVARSPDGRLWLFGPNTHVYVSNRSTPDRPTDYETFALNIDPVTRGDPLQGWDFEIGGDITDEEIKWGGFFNDRPYSFTRRWLYAINASSQVNWGAYAVTKAHSVGCINGDTVAEVDGWLYWVAEGARVFRWDGRSAPEDIGHLTISPRLLAAPAEFWRHWFARSYRSAEDGTRYALYYVPEEDAVLAEPTDLTATAVSTTEIDLAWTDNTMDELGYAIERSLDDVTFTQIATVAADVTTYNDTGLTPDTVYYYRVRAFEGVGTIYSDYSNTANDTTDSDFPYPNMLFVLQSDRLAVQTDNTDLTTWANYVNSNPSAPDNAVGPSPNAGVNKMRYRTAASGSAINGLPVVQGGQERGMGFYIDATKPKLANKSWTFYWAGRMPALPAATDGDLWADYIGPGGYTDPVDGQTVARLFMHFASGGSSDRLGYAYAVANTINEIAQTTADNIAGVQVLTWVFDKSIPSCKVYRNGELIFTGTFSSGGGTWDITDDFVELFTSGDNSGGFASSFRGDTTDFWGATSAHDNTTRTTIEAILISRLGLVTPNAPSSLNATTASSSQIDLTWTDNASNEDGFYVYQSTDNVTFTLIATKAANATSHSVTGLTASTLYYFKVRAFKGTMRSSYSNTDSDTTSASLISPYSLSNQAWIHEADQIGGSPADNSDLTTWPDTSTTPANGRTITFPSASDPGGSKPKYRTNRFGSLPAIQSRSGDEGEMAMGSPINNSAFTHYFVLDYVPTDQPDGSVALFYPLEIVISIGGSYFAFSPAADNFSTNRLEIEEDFANYNIGASTTGKQLIVVVANKAAGTISVYRGKTLIGTASGLGTGGWNWDGYTTYFSVVGGTLSRYVGYLAADYAFKTNHDTTTREGVSDWIANKWGT